LNSKFNYFNPSQITECSVSIFFITNPNQPNDLTLICGKTSVEESWQVKKTTFSKAVQSFCVYRRVLVPHLGQRLRAEREHGNMVDMPSLSVNMLEVVKIQIPELHLDTYQES